MNRPAFFNSKVLLFVLTLFFLNQTQAQVLSYRQQFGGPVFPNDRSRADVPAAF